MMNARPRPLVERRLKAVLDAQAALDDPEASKKYEAAFLEISGGTPPTAETIGALRQHAPDLAKRIEDESGFTARIQALREAQRELEAVVPPLDVRTSDEHERVLREHKELVERIPASEREMAVKSAVVDGVLDGVDPLAVLAASRKEVLDTLDIDHPAAQGAVEYSQLKQDEATKARIAAYQAVPEEKLQADFKALEEAYNATPEVDPNIAALQAEVDAMTEKEKKA